MRPAGRRRVVIRGLILLLWVAMLGLLLRFEAFPEYFTHALPGYRSLLAGDVLLDDAWTRILHKEQPIGYSHTTVEVNDSNPQKHYAMLNRTYVRLKAMGLNQPVFIDTSAYVDVSHRLQEFGFMLSSRDHTMRIRGVRDAATTFFDVTMNSGSQPQKMRVEIPDDVILYSPMTEMAMKRLRPGGELTIRTFDPAILAPSRMVLHAIREEDVPNRPAGERGMLLETEVQGITVRSWVSKDGTLLRQETPLGWILESCTADEALATVRESAHGGDWVADFAVRASGIAIPDAKSSRFLRLRLTGVALDLEQLASNRQKPHRVNDGVELRITKARYPADEAAPESLSDAERKAGLESTTFVQAADPKIIATAERIVAGCVTDADKVRKLVQWVHRNVRKETTISLPSALDVLEQMAGDCNEHTYLFTALARAAGLPAKIMVGMAYHEGAFYYHAWPAVYVGVWVEVDPTWGEEAADATHIRFVEGELAQQMEIIKLVGRLQIDVLETM